MYDFWSTLTTWMLFFVYLEYKYSVLTQKFDLFIIQQNISNPNNYSIPLIVFEKYKNILEICEKKYNIERKLQSSLKLEFRFEYNVERPDNWKAAFLDELASSPENTMSNDIAKKIETLMDEKLKLKVVFFTKHVIWRKDSLYLPSQELFYRIEAFDPLLDYIWKQRILGSEKNNLSYSNLPTEFHEMDGVKKFTTEEYKDFGSSVIENIENDILWECKGIIRDVTDKFGIVSLYV